MSKIMILCCCGAVLKKYTKSHYYCKKHIDHLLKENLSDDAYNTIEYIEINIK